MPDSIKEVDTKKDSGITPESDKVKVNTTNTVKPDIKPTGGFGNTVKKAFKAVVDFSNRHPVLTGIAKAVGAAGIAAVTDAVINGGRSSSGKSGSSDYDYNPSRSSSSISDSGDDVLVDNSGNFSIERSSPEEHMVKGHGQHYHYKDGSVRWKEKDPYPRGGNKDE